MSVSLFDALRCGELALANRVVMAPMTRSRAGLGDVPDDLHVEYYRQRATAGLIVSEGTQPGPNGKGYCRTPGIHSPAQIAAWRRVTDAVHAAGGRIVMQLMHVGRIASRLNQSPEAEIVAPSAVRAQGQMFTDAGGMVDFDLPRALTTSEIAGVIDEYRQATVNALTAGFDGVELHCTSGYLPMQFLASNTNLRTDRYGGSVTNRIRFVVETLEALAGAARPGRVGLRICPGNPFNDVVDAAPLETYGALLPAIAPLQLAYLHVIRSPLPEIDAFALARRHFAGPLIINDSFDGASAAVAVAAGIGDAVSFGRHYIGNPDLVARLRRGATLAAFDRRTLYTPGPKGYTDYPALPT
jgi:N-ethylmaleimide reductase